MAMENAAERHTTADEEETTVAMNWQSGNSDNNGSNNSGSYENPEDELGYLLQKREARDLDCIPEEEVW
jgi:hypothetical protein